MAATIIRHKSITTRWDRQDMKTEDMIRMNAAANGRLIVGMLFAMNMFTGSQALAFVALLIVCAAYVADGFLSAGKAAWSGAMSMGILISTLILGVATWFAI